ncbi:fumarylacetoacetate hydrolase family protein, partial [Citrobacter amalonaticus]|uniref:fumarylacetoacetate hydrolase family protein n=1 Tax=Citrobacter amalonaticus TaxID=35703 RepID=UPI000B0D506A
MYQHHNWQGALLDYPVSKVVCVGSNYANHIKEMGSVTPDEPVLFIKPETALCDLRQPLVIPTDMGSVHHEVELAVLIGATLRQATEEHVRKAIAGYGVALDLTLRDIQGKMKKAGQPWEKAKGFDNSCPLSGFIPVATILCFSFLGFDGIASLSEETKDAERVIPKAIFLTALIGGLVF